MSLWCLFCDSFFFKDTATTGIYTYWHTLSLHDARPICVSGVDEMSSYVGEGNSSTFVQFAVGTPIDRAYNDVNQAVSQIRSELPDGILEPQVVRVDISAGPITNFSVEAADMTLEQLSWFGDTIGRAAGRERLCQ